MTKATQRKKFSLLSLYEAEYLTQTRKKNEVLQKAEMNE